MNKPASLAQLFLDRVSATPAREAFRYPTASGSWTSLTWSQIGSRVRNLASGLRAIGLADEERVTIVAGTRIEWILADLAILCAAGATTTIYPASTPDECAYILNDSKTAIVFAEDEGQVKKLREKRQELPSVKKVVCFADLPPADGDDDWVMSLAALETLGKTYDRENAASFDATVARVTKDHLATLIYTSGTTGTPKGVELIHDSWLFQADGIATMGTLEQDDLQYLWLPMAHIFGKVLLAGQIKVGFATAIDGRVDKIVENLAVVRPTIVGAVPRIFEKVHAKVVDGAKEAGGLKLKIFEWALGIGKKVSALRQKGKEPTGLLAMQNRLAHKLVFSKLHARFGGRLRAFVSGSAPLDRGIMEFFHAFGILILEGYGLTEASASNFVNRLDHYKFGTVGLPTPGTEVKIDPGDGEILLRCRGVMRGYHGMEEATREAIDSEGWLHTGDIGELDADGFLTITDRKKDLIKTSNGKYVAPQMLEGKLKTSSSLISQVVVHGDRRKYCAALITIDEEGLAAWAAREGQPGDRAAWIKSDALDQEIRSAVDALNATLPSYSTIKRFAILPTDFTVEAGELTASLKVRRKVIEKKFQKELDGLYADA